MRSLEVRLVGHACVELLVDDKRFLCDPWLGNNAVNNGLVWMYPPVTTSTENFYEADYIYISHDHDDHCNQETLEGFRRDIPIYILDFPNNNYNLEKIL